MKTYFLILLFSLSVSLGADAQTVLSVKQFCEAWFPALVRGDQNSQLAAKNLVETFYTDDAILIDPNFSTEQIGSQALKNYYQAILEKYPNWSFKIIDIYPKENGFILHYMGTVPGQVDSFRGVDIIDFDPTTLANPPNQWRISKLIGIYDRTPFQKPKNESSHDK